MSQTPVELAEAMEATWPPAALQRVGPWTIRDGAGGGKRVSAATADSDWQLPDLPRAEAAMQALGQKPLFLIRDGDGALDAALDARGYRLIDPVVAYCTDLAGLAPGPAPMTTFAHWPPLAAARLLWAEGGIGPARLAVMDRVAGPKTALLARSSDRAAGVAFVALHGPVGMLHALETTPGLRRQGSAQNLLRAAAVWAQGLGAERLALVVTKANAPARALYERLGMGLTGHYHYRER